MVRQMSGNPTYQDLANYSALIRQIPTSAAASPIAGDTPSLSRGPCPQLSSASILSKCLFA
jgi:hypothetical protein